MRLLLNNKGPVQIHKAAATKAAVVTANKPVLDMAAALWALSQPSSTGPCKHTEVHADCSSDRRHGCGCTQTCTCAPCHSTGQPVWLDVSTLHNSGTEIQNQRSKHWQQPTKDRDLLAVELPLEEPRRGAL